MLFTSLLVHASAVTLTPTVTSIGGGLYKYAYSISYSGPDDAFLIDIGVPANPAAVTNLTVPTGFTSQFDSGPRLGVVCGRHQFLYSHTHLRIFV